MMFLNTLKMYVFSVNIVLENSITKLFLDAKIIKYCIFNVFYTYCYDKKVILKRLAQLQMILLPLWISWG